MRIRSFALATASFTALALAGPAAAQQTDAAQPGTTDPSASAPATDPAAAPADDGETIVVTGLRRSLQSAQNIKRNSDQIVDAIVAEDIGKLPDIAVSDTAARIPGIQVERSGGEASNVLVRGLDEVYYTTTYNGREIFTAETRSVALQDFPAGGISAIEAFKTSTANLVEPGLAGLINVRSRRPFDFQGREVAGSVWGVYPLQSRDFEPNAQLLLSDRWQTGIGEVGALINFSYTRLHYQDSIRRHGFFIADLAGGRSPDFPEINYGEAERWRPSINGALQWRPSADLEFYAEGLWQGYREDVSDRQWRQPLWGGEYSNIVFEQGTNRIISGTVTNPAGCCGGFQTEGFQGATKRRTNTYQFAVGGRYDAGPLLITGDIARTDSTFNLRAESVDYDINTEAFSVDWFTGLPGGDGPTFQVRGLDFANPAIYNYRGFFEDYLTAKGDDWQARLDFTYEPAGLEFVKSVQWGVRYVDRDAGARAGSVYYDLNDRGIPISAVPLDYVLYDPAFRGDDNKPTPLTWLSPTFNSVWDNLRALREFNYAQLQQRGLNLPDRASLDGPLNDPGRTFAINERTLAGYAQVNTRFDLGSAEVEGTFGLRAVKTKSKINGTVFNPTGPAPIDFENDYTDWLPNASIRARLSPQWQLRLAATQTRTRPSFGQLNPSLNLGAPPSCGTLPPGTECVRLANGGNPFLRPLDSNNYDASVEYYFSRTGFASVAAFYRDMKGFIANRAFTFPEPDAATGAPLRVTGPVNTNQATIKGFEAQVRTFLDFGGLPAWAKGFGVEANLTYLDAKADFLLFQTPGQLNSGTTIRDRIPDVSKWTYNLVGMYEAGGLTARLAYNKRSGYPEGPLVEDCETCPVFTRQGRGRGSSRLDWSSSYAFNDKLTLFFDWTNILANPFKSDIVRVNYSARNNGVPTGREVFPMVVRYEESVLSSGIRFRF